MTAVKKFFRDIHLYLGLAAGLVIMITCFTGAALVFEKELQQSIYPERYFVEAKGNVLPLETIIANLKTKLPGTAVNGVKVYSEADRSIEISYSGKEKDQSGTAFMNPYTGELISLYSYRTTFFYTMFSLHRWLLAGDTGKLIVGISTSIFLFILITGIILWWPANKKKLKQRLKLKWNAGWKRVNHDLHIVLGFYASIFLFAFAFTGLAWSFQWFNNGIYWITGTESKRPDPPASVYDSTYQTISWDDAYLAIKQNVTNVQYYNISSPKDSASAISVSTLPADPVHEKASDQYYLDQYSGQMLGTFLYQERNLGQRTRSLFYPIHVGSIGGLPGRIIALLACLAGTIFPITGVIMWINRLKKKEKKAKKKLGQKTGKRSTEVVT